MLYLSCFLLGGLMFQIYSLSVAYMNDRVNNEDMLEATRAILLVYGAGALLGPIVAGGFMTIFGPTWLFYYISIILVGFFIYANIRVHVTDAVPQEDRTTFVPITRTSKAVLEMDPRLDEEHKGHPEGRDRPPDSISS